MITEYVAKPNLNNNIGLKTFSLESDAIKYLVKNTQAMRCLLKRTKRQARRFLIGI